MSRLNALASVSRRALPNYWDVIAFAAIFAVLTLLARVAPHLHAALPAGGLEPVREIVRIEVRDPHAMSLVVEETGDMKTMETVEAEVIRFALQFYRGRMSEVSRRLGIGRSTLYRKLKELGLDEEERSEDAA